ncbi:MAG: CpaF family protein [Candidatus Omnitrophica bacterium]|nr:CpaF family protein [Candidatus Omnitrophota bacterium]
MSDTIKQKINKYLISETDFLKYKDKMTEEQMRSFIDQVVVEVCNEQKIKLSKDEQALLIKNLVSDNISLGPLRTLMQDETVTEIMINGHKKIYVQRFGRIELTNIAFETEQSLNHTIQKILHASGTNKRVDESSPFVDFSLNDGSRVNVIIPPLSQIGPVVTIRKFRDDIKDADDLVNLKELNEEIAALIVAGMKARLNIVFCGSTGAGKTTALNVFSKYIPSDERIVTIEDTPELRLKQGHVVSLTSRPANLEGKGEITMRELFVNSLRMRPDRIIVGEIRGGEMLDLIESITSGHSGSLAIVHAETTQDCFSRMVTMTLMTGIPLSTEEIQKQVSSAIDMIIHIELFMDGVRRVTCVTDIHYNEKTAKVELNNIFEFKQESVSDSGAVIGDWVKSKRKPSFYHKFEKRRVSLPDGYFD